MRATYGSSDAARTVIAPPGPRTFSTNFATTGNPMPNPGGLFKLGGTDGLLWTDPKVIAAGACTTQVTGGGVDDDSIYCLQGWNANQEASGQLVLDPALHTGSHECEILLRFSISANDAHGYECNYSYGNGAGGPAYCQFVQWLGGLNQFLVIAQTFSAPAPQTGDIITANIIGTTMSLWIDQGAGKQLVQTHDVSTDINGNPIAFWATGSPGGGFYMDVDNIDDQYLFRNWSAKEL